MKTDSIQTIAEHNFIGDKIIDTPHVQIKIEDNILIVLYKKDLTIDLNVAKELVRLRLLLTNNKPFPVLLYGQGGIEIDKAARDYLSSSEGIRAIIAAAFVVKSTFERLVGNFFVEINKAQIPVKLFPTQKAASLWLKQYL